MTARGAERLPPWSLAFRAIHACALIRRSEIFVEAIENPFRLFYDPLSVCADEFHSAKIDGLSTFCHIPYDEDGSDTKGNLLPNFTEVGKNYLHPDHARTIPVPSGPVPAWRRTPE